MADPRYPDVDLQPLKGEAQLPDVQLPVYRGNGPKKGGLKGELKKGPRVMSPQEAALVIQMLRTQP